jgi:predicted ATP-binding protein involved in virulence
MDALKRATVDWGAYQVAMSHYGSAPCQMTLDIAKILLASHFAEVEIEARRRRPELYEKSEKAQ